jgi:hypothetical protein
MFFLIGKGRHAGQKKVIEVSPFFPVDPEKGFHNREERLHGHQH